GERGLHGKERLLQSGPSPQTARAPHGTPYPPRQRQPLKGPCRRRTRLCPAEGGDGALHPYHRPGTSQGEDRLGQYHLQHPSSGLARATTGESMRPSRPKDTALSIAPPRLQGKASAMPKHGTACCFRTSNPVVRGPQLVLAVVTGPRRQAPKSHGPQFAAHGGFCHLDTELLVEPAHEICKHPVSAAAQAA